MTWFWENGNELFILFLIPIVGLVIDFSLTKRITLYTFGISAFLLLPILTGYIYIIPYFYQILGLTSLGCLYSFYSRQIEMRTPKIISAILFSVLLFVILGFFAFMDSMSGFQKVENSWTIGKYKIEYTKDQGFAGGALMKYEISKYSFIPLLIKKVDYAVDNDTTSSCLIHFTDIKIVSQFSYQSGFD